MKLIELTDHSADILGYNNLNTLETIEDYINDLKCKINNFKYKVNDALTRHELSMVIQDTFHLIACRFGIIRLPDEWIYLNDIDLKFNVISGKELKDNLLSEYKMTGNNELLDKFNRTDAHSITIQPANEDTLKLFKYMNL